LDNKISVTILCKNSSKYIHECLSALEKFDEIIVLDNGSTDNTIDIVNSFSKTKVYENSFIGFGPLKNLAISKTNNNWVLSVDSDEILSQELVTEILNLKLNKQKVYSISRDNYYDGKLIRCCGWEKDYVIRLFNKNVTQFNHNQVHESLILKKIIQVETLQNKLKHYTFDDPSQLIKKMDYYSTLYAKEYMGIKKSSLSKAIGRSIFSFIKNYFLQKGFLNGYEGLLISVSNANGVFYKYIKLMEENKK